jgi:hypothetical protein
MRWSLTLIVLLAGLAVSGLIWWATGGKAFVRLLPLLFGLPLLTRRGGR